MVVRRKIESSHLAFLKKLHHPILCNTATTKNVVKLPGKHFSLFNKRTSLQPPTLLNQYIYFTTSTSVKH